VNEEEETMQVISRVSEKRRLARLGAIAGLLTSVLAVVAAAPAEAGTQPIVSAGGTHTCAVRGDGSVWCWGSTAFIQLGSPTVPAQVAMLPLATAVASGYGHTCAIAQTNDVYCWGSNLFGELGNGTTSTYSGTPGKVTGGLKALQVSAGNGDTCAVTLTHTVECWGDNDYGELGDGTTSDSSTPRLVKGLTGVDQVAVGYFHTCALLSNGKVECWGSNPFGSLGNGTTADSDVPVYVTGVRDAISIAAGSDVSCAILTGDDLKCWGDNYVGQLGTGNFTDSLVPAQVSGLTSGVEEVSLGESYGCALIESPGATVVCWGNAEGYGSLGNGNYNEDDPFPTTVFGLQTPPAGGGVTIPYQISAGTFHACVVLYSGKVLCWGAGDDGDLGDGTNLDVAIPTPTIGLPEPAGSVNTVSAGVGTSCAVTSSFNADCWGIDTGNGSFASQLSAVPVTSLPAGGVVQVSASNGGCALTVQGALKCWGYNAFGAVGDGTTTNRSSPVDVKGMSSAVLQVSTNSLDTCDLVFNGGAFCWGWNKDGQLGDGTTSDSHTPVAVKSLPVQLAQIGVGVEFSCALTFAGPVQCWGDNSVGELGDGSTKSSKIPVAVTGLTGVAEIAVGSDFGCALTSAGAVSCWGDNSYGELGDGTTTNSDVPVQVSGLTSGVLAISAGALAACATLQSGSVECWGDNGYGELGDGSAASSLTPVTVSSFSSDGFSISAGQATTCGLNSSEQAECWGDSADGQLGDGSTANSDVPVMVNGL
jgi:alpha-tubulin suppressor-like RCC1 family protein